MKAMKKIGIIGHFAFNKEYNDGQSVKTREFAKILEKHFTAKEIDKVDTYGGIKKLPSIILKSILLGFKCKNIVMLPAHNGVRVFTPLLNIIKIILKKNVYYAVVGGWLPGKLEKKKKLKKMLKTFDALLVETTIMKMALENQGFENVYVMPNFKDLPYENVEQKQFYDEPYVLCTFSRVMKEKGIEDAIKAVEFANVKLNRRAYELHIFGQIDNNQIEWFNQLIFKSSDYVKYCGFVSSEKSVEILRNYFALLFPTKFYTEGIPGTIIDSLVSGVPVIASKWQSYADILEDGYNAICYEFDRNEMLGEILVKIAENPGCIVNMKQSCMDSAKKFMPENAIKVFLELL